MRYISTAKTLALVVLACFLHVSTATAQAVRTNSLDSMRAIYDEAVARIATDTQQQKADALGQYGTNLDAILTSLKLKGDIDAYAVVNQETKRFRTDKTILTNASDVYIGKAVTAYQKQVTAADTDSTRRKAALLNQYIAALGRLVKDLMLRDKIEEATAAGNAKKAAEAMLAEIENGQSKPVEVSVNPPVQSVQVPQPSPADTVAPKTADVPAAATVLTRRPPTADARTPPLPVGVPNVESRLPVAASSSTHKDMRLEDLKLDLVWVEPGRFHINWDGKRDQTCPFGKRVCVV